MAFPGILLTHQLDGTHHRAGLGNGVYGFGGLHSEALRDTHGIWSVCVHSQGRRPPRTTALSDWCFRRYAWLALWLGPLDLA